MFIEFGETQNNKHRRTTECKSIVRDHKTYSFPDAKIRRSVPDLGAIGMKNMEHDFVNMMQKRGRIR